MHRGNNDHLPATSLVLFVVVKGYSAGAQTKLHYNWPAFLLPSVSHTTKNTIFALLINCHFTSTLELQVLLTKNQIPRGPNAKNVCCMWTWGNSNGVHFFIILYNISVNLFRRVSALPPLQMSNAVLPGADICRGLRTECRGKAKGRETVRLGIPATCPQILLFYANYRFLVGLERSYGV